MNILQKFEGKGSLSSDYTALSKTLHALLVLGHVQPTDLTENQKTCFTAWLKAHEKRGSCPKTREAFDYL